MNKTVICILLFFGILGLVFISGPIDNKRTAKGFWKKHSDGANIHRLQLMKGINFRKDVDVVILKKGFKLAQYQLPKNPQGSFYTCLKCDLKKLAILTEGRVKKIWKVVKKTEALKSITKEVEWYSGGKMIEAPGGEIQYWIPCIPCLEEVK